MVNNTEYVFIVSETQTLGPDLRFLINCHQVGLMLTPAKIQLANNVIEFQEQCSCKLTLCDFNKWPCVS